MVRRLSLSFDLKVFIACLIGIASVKVSGALALKCCSETASIMTIVFILIASPVAAFSRSVLHQQQTIDIGCKYNDCKI